MEHVPQVGSVWPADRLGGESCATSGVQPAVWGNIATRSDTAEHNRARKKLPSRHFPERDIRCAIFRPAQISEIDWEIGTETWGTHGVISTQICRN
jgi:hypothetical protein